MRSPGGFVWWYADLVDPDGNGVVLIASWGLPFLPGYAGAARRGRAQPAGDRPSLAISVYERGVLAYYLLQELDPADAARDGDTLRFGSSVLTLSPGSLRADLVISAPGGRLIGAVEIEGVPRKPLLHPPLQHPDHEWCPLIGPARGTWDLQAGDHIFRGEGSGYLDRNAGRGDLESLGLARWTWARVQLPDRLRIGYALWPTDGPVQAVIVDVHPDGRAEVHTASVRPGPTRRNLWGMLWWPHLKLHSEQVSMAIRVRHRPDDGPFYLRHLCDVDTEQGSALGVGEVCVTSRIDHGWSRPLVAMCVHRPNGPNSRWLPLFAGPRRGRFTRLLRAA
jgi:hypothetical protein